MILCKKTLLATGLLTISATALAEGVAPVTNQAYQEECSACHFAYQPGLLPVRSWQRLFSRLDDHFGENAELDEATRKVLLDYALGHAADLSTAKRSLRINRSLKPDQAPLRITRTPYIQNKHRRIAARWISGNPEVRSLSNCDACHTRAIQGSFNERQVRIPGYRR